MPVTYYGNVMEMLHCLMNNCVLIAINVYPVSAIIIFFSVTYYILWHVKSLASWMWFVRNVKKKKKHQWVSQSVSQSHSRSVSACIFVTARFNEIIWNILVAMKLWCFSCIFRYKFTYILIYHNILVPYLHLLYFHVSNSTLSLQSTILFSFPMHIALTISIW